MSQTLSATQLVPSLHADKSQSRGRTLPKAVFHAVRKVTSLTQGGVGIESLAVLESLRAEMMSPHDCCRVAV